MDASVLQYNEEKLPSLPNLMDEIELRILEIGGEFQTAKEGSDLAPVKHHFTPGLYTREIFMPEGLVITSKIHMTEHPYIVSQGRCLVMTEDGIWQEIKAPHFGITKPGTRRFLVMLEDTIWTTCHVTNLTDVEDIEKEIIYKRDNPLIQEYLNKTMKQIKDKVQ